MKLEAEILINAVLPFAELYYTICTITWVDMTINTFKCSCVQTIICGGMYDDDSPPSQILNMNADINYTQIDS